MRPLTIITILITLFTFLIIPFHVSAVEEPNYFTLKGGLYSPQGDLADEDFDNGYTAEFNFGHYFSPFWSLDFGVGYLRATSSFEGSDTDPSLGSFSFEQDNVASAIPITLTAKGHIPLDVVELYGGVGAGIYFVFFDADIETTLAEPLDNVSIDADDTVFGYHVLGGANLNITRSFYVGLEGKYLWTSEAEGEDKIFGQPLTIKAKLTGYTITGVLGFRF